MLIDSFRGIVCCRFERGYRSAANACNLRSPGNAENSKVRVTRTVSGAGSERPKKRKRMSKRNGQCAHVVQIRNGLAYLCLEKSSTCMLCWPCYFTAMSNASLFSLIITAKCDVFFFLRTWKTVRIKYVNEREKRNARVRAILVWSAQLQSIVRSVARPVQHCTLNDRMPCLNPSTCNSPVGVTAVFALPGKG